MSHVKNMAAPRPGNTERGWNDPPVFDYQSSSVLQSAHKRTNLNKRVAYPLSQDKEQGNSITTGATFDPSNGPPLLMPGPPVTDPPVHLLPPVPTTNAPTPVPLLVPGMVVTSAPPSAPTVTPQVNLCSGQWYSSLEEAVRGLNLQSPDQLVDYITASLHQGVDKIKSSLTERSFDDVKKKIQMFRESWDKLSPPVKCGMSNLAEGLRKNNFDAAWSVHQNLMVDYTAEVNAWMVGIKKIVHELKNLTDSLPTKDTEVSEQIESQLSSPETGMDTIVSSDPGNQDELTPDTGNSQTDTQTDTAKS